MSLTPFISRNAEAPAPKYSIQAPGAELPAASTSSLQLYNTASGASESRAQGIGGASIPPATIGSSTFRASTAIDNSSTRLTTSGGGIRPSTGIARPSTSSHVARQYNVVVLAVNRARQVGIATVNLGAMHKIELLQIVDNQSYSQTLALLQCLSPIEIVMPKATNEPLLYQKVVAYWGSAANPLRTTISAINVSMPRMVPCATTSSCRTIKCANATSHHAAPLLRRSAR